MNSILNLARVSVGAHPGASQIKAASAGLAMNLVKHAVEPVKTLAFLAPLLIFMSSISPCAFKHVLMVTLKVSGFSMAMII